MPRAAWLALALLLSVPALAHAARLAGTGLFLVEFLSGGRWRPLSALTAAPRPRPLEARVDGHQVPADLWVAPALRRPPGLVLVHGLAAAGKDDPRLGEAAGLLARLGWAVAVPTVEGLTVLRLRPGDADAPAAAARALARAGHRPVAVIGISLGAGPALLAAGEPGLAAEVSAVLALGGYASAVELLRYTLTGAYAFQGVQGRRPVREADIAVFARANAELLEPAGRALVENRDPRAFDGLVARLPPATLGLLADLSPEGRLDRLRTPLFLVHGTDDPAVPFTESLRLARAAAAAGRPARLSIVGALGHVDPDRRAGVGDLLRLWAAFYAFRATAG